jgi:hypothetical protein
VQDHPGNQTILAGLRRRGVADSALLTELGLQVTAEGKIKAVPTPKPQSWWNKKVLPLDAVENPSRFELELPVSVAIVFIFVQIPVRYSIKEEGVSGTRTGYDKSVVLSKLFFLIIR